MPRPRRWGLGVAGVKVGVDHLLDAVELALPYRLERGFTVEGRDRRAEPVADRIVIDDLTEFRSDSQHAIDPRVIAQLQLHLTMKDLREIGLVDPDH